VAALFDVIAITKGICQLYMHTLFTPNYDELNDIFRVKDPGFIENFKMFIYNRWGWQ
jgi:gliding motility-associated-like protein